MARTIVAPAVFALALGAYGQAISDHPRFEVSSIKLAKSVANFGGSMRSDPGRIDYKLIDLKSLILKAYAVSGYQVAWPEWLKKGAIPSYDVVATMPAGTTAEHRRLMLQELLEERLKLKLHRETRELPVYALAIAKSGLRIHKAKIDSDANDPDADPEEPHNTYRIAQSGSGWHIVGPMSVPQLAGTFRFELDRPMVDMTGLEGYYDIDLVCARERAPLPGRGAAIVDDANGMPVASTPAGGNSAALFAALEKQLGLKVEPRKIQVEMLVIDHVERLPTEN